MAKNEGGPAFPSNLYGYDVEGKQIVQESWPGITRRQWYKGMALAGYNASQAYGNEDSRKKAEWAADDADAMIKEDESIDS